MELWELEAREAVRRTIGAYVNAGDQRKLVELAACFSDDGVMQVSGDEPLQGRAAIVSSLEAVLPSKRLPSHAHHHVTSTFFSSVSREAIESSSYFMVVTDCGPDHWGRYRDCFVPADGGWLLASRRITVDGFAPDSFFRPT